MRSQATVRPGPRCVDASEEGWRRLAGLVTHERINTFKCDSVRQLSKVIGISENTLYRVENSQPVSRSTLVRLDTALKWQPGTAERALLDTVTMLISASDGAPVLYGKDEEEVWASLKAIKQLKDRERYEAFAKYRKRCEEENRQQVI